MAVQLASRKKNTIPLRIVAEKIGMPLAEVFRALIKSQAGEVETYGKDDLTFYVFLCTDIERLSASSKGSVSCKPTGRQKGKTQNQKHHSWYIEDTGISDEPY